MRRRLLALCAFLALAAGGAFAYQRLRPLPRPAPGDPARGERAFWDSDLGSKSYGSIPRAVFEALPRLRPDLLPEGWAGVGLLENPKDPHGPPIGMVRERAYGLEVYASNCALCHAGEVNGQLVAGAPNANLDVPSLLSVVDRAMREGSLTASSLVEDAARAGAPLRFSERLALRAWLFTARRIIERKPANWFTNEVGAGRSDALNGWKRALGIDTSAHRSFVDIPSLFNQRLKTRTLLDGSITGDGAARIMLTELQKGRPTRDPLLDRQVFDDLVAFMDQALTPPPFPFPLDAARAARGHTVFLEACSRCHGRYGADGPSYPSLRIGADVVGTDRERADAMTPEVATALQRYDFKQFLSVDPRPAYMPPALGGIWLTGPFLHNGSVPTLWHLLQPPSERPVLFSRRWSGFDPTRVGLSCPETRAGGALACDPDEHQKNRDPRTVFRFDTKKPGNGNGGHLYGVELPVEDKWAVVEYLKTI